MVAIIEGSTSLPQDSQGRYMAGLYIPALDAFNGWRGDENNSAQVALWGTNDLPLLTTTNPGNMRTVVSNNLLQSLAVSFASNLAALTASPQVVIATPNGLTSSCLVMVTNPSTATALTVSVQMRDTFTGALTHYPELATFSVPANTPEGIAVVVTGWLAGTGGRIVLTNASQVEVAGFTALVNVRQL